MNLLLLLGVLSATTPQAQPPLDEVIRGDWCAGSKKAFHEEFSLDLQDGVRVFKSWLHEKPDLTGTWELRGRSLVIRGANGDRMEYKILRASRTRLVVRDANEKYNETYLRQGKCVAFENPYKDPNFRDSPPN
jgi:hypothetical protein